MIEIRAMSKPSGFRVIDYPNIIGMPVLIQKKSVYLQHSCKIFPKICHSCDLCDRIDQITDPLLHVRHRSHGPCRTFPCVQTDQLFDCDKRLSLY